MPWTVRDPARRSIALRPHRPIDTLKAVGPLTNECSPSSKTRENSTAHPVTKMQSGYVHDSSSHPPSTPLATPSLPFRVSNQCVSNRKSTVSGLIVQHTLFETPMLRILYADKGGIGSISRRVSTPTVSVASCFNNLGMMPYMHGQPDNVLH